MLIRSYYFYDVIDAGFSAIGSYMWLESRADRMTASKRVPKSRRFLQNLDVL